MGVDIPIYGTFHRFFWQADLDRSGKIDTPAEVVQLAKLAYESQNPEAGLDFERIATPILRKAKWTIPSVYRRAFSHLGRLHREGQKNPTKPIGWVEVQIPFSPDMAALMREYYPRGGYRRSSDGRHEFISDHHGRLLMLIVRDNQDKIVRIFSPRSRRGLRSALLYLPEPPQTEFAALLGLPKPRWSDLRRYTLARAKEFLAEPATPQSTASSNGGWQRAHSIAQAIHSQRGNDPTYIGFPGFGVTTMGNGNSPVLESRFLRNCIGLVIYDRRIGKALLSHMTTLHYEEGYYQDLPDLACIFNNNERTRDTLSRDNETARILGSAWRPSTHFFSTLCEGRSFPMQWYVAVFRTIYFQNSNPQDIEVTVISTEVTPRRAVENLIASARLFFAGTKLAWLESAPYDDQINYAVNAYTGDLTFGRSTCDEFGCATLQGTPRMIARRP